MIFYSAPGPWVLGFCCGGGGEDVICAHRNERKLVAMDEEEEEASPDAMMDFLRPDGPPLALWGGGSITGDWKPVSSVLLAQDSPL